MGIADIKKNIRSTLRLLEKTNDSRKIRELKQRLRALLGEWEIQILAQVEKKHELKYKKVEFFEQQKAKRKVEKGETGARKELAYCLFYPKTIKYISLYKECLDDNKEVGDRRNEILSVLDRILETGDMGEKDLKDEKVRQKIYRQLRIEMPWLSDLERQLVSKALETQQVYGKAKQVLDYDTVATAEHQAQVTEGGGDKAVVEEQDDFFVV